jgi:hypothetical protein
MLKQILKIVIEYLNDCHKYHEEFLDDKNELKTKKIVLDGNLDIYENSGIIDIWIKEIDKFIN